MSFVERHERRYPDGRVLRTWRARYRDPSGRERSKTFQRRTDAEKFLAIVEGDKLRGEWTDPRLAQVLLSEWAERWMGTTSHLKPKTRSGYESLLRTLVLPRFGEVPLGRIEPLMLREWVSDLAAEGLSASRIRQAYRLLSAMFQAAVESGYLAKSPCVGVSLPRMPEQEMRFLSADQVRVLADAVGDIGKRGDHYRVLIYVLAFTGIRWGEATALRRRRVDMLRGRLNVVESLADINGHLVFGPTKTHQIRTVALPRFLRELLAHHLEDVEEDPDTLVFAASGGQPLRSPNFARSVWRPGLRAAGLPEDLRVHDLRHTCASLLIAEGAHPKVIQRQLGHRSIETTMNRYGHLYGDEMDLLADALDSAWRSATDPMRTRPGPEVVELRPQEGGNVT